MEKRDHQFIVTARDKDVTLRLLEAYGIKYKVVGKIGKGRFHFIKEWVVRDQIIYSIAKRFQPSILTGIHNPSVAHVAWLTGAKSIIFTDNDLTMLTNIVTFPFADVVCTPDCFKKDIGKKQVYYNGYKELAYLHPNYFRPDPSVLDDLGLKEEDRYIVVRFVAWQAIHDRGQHGFDTQSKYKLLNRLQEYARVFVTSEAPLPVGLQKYEVAVSPERLHDLLYYATMFVGDCGTTAAEAGILGTPTVRYNTFVGPDDLGFLTALEQKDGVIHSFSELDQVTSKAEEILTRENLKREWSKKRQSILTDKIDVTQFMVEFIENYPESFMRYRNNQAKT